MAQISRGERRRHSSELKGTEPNQSDRQEGIAGRLTPDYQDHEI